MAPGERPFPGKATCQNTESSASRTAKLFVVVVCLIILLLEAWSAWRAYEMALDEANRDGL
jgi:DNA-binding transcriptional regulator of glucitol operon